jgi:hypothetical protein
MRGRRNCLDSGTHTDLRSPDAENREWCFRRSQSRIVGRTECFLHHRAVAVQVDGVPLGPERTS